MNIRHTTTVVVMILWASSIAFAQTRTVSGVISSASSKQPLRAQIRIPALRRATVCDAQGKFRISNLPSGTFIVEISALSYKEVTREINTTNGDVTLDVSVEESALRMPTVTVTAEPQPTDALESPLSVDVLEGRELERLRGQSVMQTLQNVPGVALFSGGPLAMKPVIRGLTAQRVVVAQNGERIQSQTWDEPQSPEIDAFDVQSIEVLRGPNSVMFGSDALGGVVNVIREDVFANESQSPLSGRVSLNAFSTNVPHVGGALTLSGASGGYVYRLNASGRTAADYNAPGGTLDGKMMDAGAVFNSGAFEYNGSGTIGMKRDWGTLSLDLVHFGQKYFIHPEPGRMEAELNIHTGKIDTLPAAPSQEILHERAALHLNMPMNSMRLEAGASFQYNSRKEEGVAETEEDEILKEEKGIPPEVKLDLISINADVKLHHAPLAGFAGTVGASFTMQDNQTLGFNHIIPEYSSMNIAGFLYEEARIVESLRWTGGIRFDTRSMDMSADTQLLNRAQRLNYNAITGTSGLAWRISEPLVIALNAGTGWRAPVAAELFTRGKDEGEARYKLGDSSLTPERSMNIDFSVRYVTSSFAIQASVFQQSIKDFIFLVPTGAKVDSVDVYTYKQADASLMGGELLLNVALSQSLVAEVGADFLRGENKESSSPLPLMTPNRVRGAIRYQVGEAFGMSNTYFGVQGRYTMKQDRLGSVFEKETPAYFLVDISLGGQVMIGGLPVTLDLSVDNALNTAYVDHLSRYRKFAFNPGINAGLRASVPFSIIQ